MCQVNYWGKGRYIGSEFVNEYGSEIEIGNDEENSVYTIRFINNRSEFNNIFEEEIDFLN